MSDSINDIMLKALKRSYRRAFETAVRTGTALVVARGDKIVEIKPPYRYKLVPIKPKRRKK
jgi:hypothetical protein